MGPHDSGTEVSRFMRALSLRRVVERKGLSRTDVGAFGSAGDSLERSLSLCGKVAVVGSKADNLDLILVVTGKGRVVFGVARTPSEIWQN